MRRVMPKPAIGFAPSPRILLKRASLSSWKPVRNPAQELLEFLENLDASNVFVNFDPANMILYGAGDPIDAVNVRAITSVTFM